MNSRFYLILALSVYLGLAVWFSARIALVKKAEIQTKVPPVSVVSEEVFKNPAISTVKGYVQFGQLPVTVDKSQQGKENPFSP